MIHLSQFQLIRLWSELEQAYYGDNKYGGNTAEIYAYTVMEYSPALCMARGTFESHKQEAYRQAAETLFDVLQLFRDQRDCSILVDGQPFTDWIGDDPIFDHRVHVKVTP